MMVMGAPSTTALAAVAMMAVGASVTKVMAAI